MVRVWGGCGKGVVRVRARVMVSRVAAPCPKHRDSSCEGRRVCVTVREWLGLQQVKMAASSHRLIFRGVGIGRHFFFL